MPKGAEKTIFDYKLTRYACYLIAQNGDSRKKVIAKNGGTMPEDLPTLKKSLKQLEKENNKSLRKQESGYINEIDIINIK